MGTSSGNFATFQAVHAPKSFLPTFWEKRTEGPLMTVAELMADGEFKPLKPVFLNRNSKIDKKFHVMFIVNIGNVIVRAIKTHRNGTERYLLYLVTNVPKNGENKYTIEAEEIFDSNSFDDFEEEFGKDIIPLLEAAREKLSNDVVDSLYHLPHNLHEIAAKYGDVK